MVKSLRTDNVVDKADNNQVAVAFDAVVSHVIEQVIGNDDHGHATFPY